MFVLANRDIELACDEAVLRRLGRDKRRAYALTLLEMEEKRSGLSALMSGMAGNAVKQRVRSVMKMKQKGIISIVLALVLVVGVYAVFATGALAEEPEEAEQTKTDTVVVALPAHSGGGARPAGKNGALRHRVADAGGGKRVRQHRHRRRLGPVQQRLRQLRPE